MPSTVTAPGAAPGAHGDALGEQRTGGERGRRRRGHLLSAPVSRRVTVLVAGVVLLLGFGLVGTLVPVPYVAQVPGPTYNTLGDLDGDPIISVDGPGPQRRQRQPEPRPRSACAAPADPGRGGAGLVRQPRSAWCPGTPCTRRTRSVEETAGAELPGLPHLRAGRRTRPALGELGYPEKVVVQCLADDSPSAGELEAGDALRPCRARRPGHRRPGRGPDRDPGRHRRRPSTTPGGARPGRRPSPPSRPTRRDGSFLGIGVLQTPARRSPCPSGSTTSVALGRPDADPGHHRPGRRQRPDRRRGHRRHRHDRRRRHGRADRRHPAEDDRRRATSTPSSSWSRRQPPGGAGQRPSPACRWPGWPPWRTR